MVKVGFFILAGLDEQIGMLNGFLTGLLLSFPPPLPQPINEGGDEEEQRADEAEEIAERPMEQLACGIGDKEQTCNFGNSDNRSFFRDNAHQMASRQQDKHHS